MSSSQNSFFKDQNPLLLAAVAAGAIMSGYYLFFGKPQEKPLRPVFLVDPLTHQNTSGAAIPEFLSLTLVKKTIISPDTRIFRFALEHPNQVLGLPTGKHMGLRAKIPSNAATYTQRSYTPITSNDDVGFVDFIIKIYFKDVNPKFPQGGKMSQHLESLAIGDTVEVKATPTGRFAYEGEGVMSQGHTVADREKNRKKAKQIGMIAGGSGITPMLQVIRHVLKEVEHHHHHNSNNKNQSHRAHPHHIPKLWLLFANRHEADVLLRQELEELAAKHPESLRVWFTLSQPTIADAGSNETWKYSSGHVNEDLIKQHLPPALLQQVQNKNDNDDDDSHEAAAKGDEDHSVVFLCGPHGMVEEACKPNLAKLGFKTDRVIVF